MRCWDCIAIVERETGRVVGLGGISRFPEYWLRRIELCGMASSNQPNFDLRAIDEADYDWILRSDWKRLRLTKGHFKRMPLLDWPNGTDEEIARA